MCFSIVNERVAPEETDFEIIHACFADKLDPRVVLVVLHSNSKQSLLFKALYLAKITDEMGFTIKEEEERL